MLCLLKLEQVRWQALLFYEAPLCFGYVPSLKELSLVCDATIIHQDISLSQVLDGATNIHTLTLNFRGEKVILADSCYIVVVCYFVRTNLMLD